MAHNDSNSGQGAAGPSSAWSAAAMLLSIAIAVVLAFAIFGKIATPHPEKMVNVMGGKLHQDHLVAAGEMAVLIALLVGHRLRLAWAGVALMFGGFLGYAVYWLIRGESCGCFGDFYNNTAFSFITNKGVSVGLDVVFVLAALGLLAWRGTGKPVIGVVAAASVAAGVFGYVYADNTAPPDRQERQQIAEEKYEGQTPEERLVRAAFPEILAQEPGGPAWYIFVWDPNCSVCAELQPFVQMFEDRWNGDEDPTLRVAQILKAEAMQRFGIEDYLWEGSPTAILVRDGRITNRYLNDDVGQLGHLPDEQMHDRLLTGTLEPNFTPGG